MMARKAVSEGKKVARGRSHPFTVEMMQLAPTNCLLWMPLRRQSGPNCQGHSQRSVLQDDSSVSLIETIICKMQCPVEVQKPIKSQ